MKKGFTLIELLAVILILGIIALIAIPTVNKIINEARYGAFKSGNDNIMKQVEQDCQTSIMKSENPTLSYLFTDGKSSNEINIKGKLPSDGYILLDRNCTVTNYYLTDNKNVYFNGEDVRENYMIKASLEADTSLFQTLYLDYYSNIKSVNFINNMIIPENAIGETDISVSNNGMVKSWLVPNGEFYDLYIGSNQKIYLNYDSNYLFKSLVNVTSYDFSNLNTQFVIKIKKLFTENNSLEYLDLNSWDTSNVTNMQSAFANSKNLKSLHIGSLNTKNVTDMANLFNNCQSLKNIDVSKFETSNVTNMYAMFHNCFQLSALDLNHFDTSKVTNMGFMFSGTDNSSNTMMKLIHLNINTWDTSKVTNMERMFSCSSVNSLDLNKWDTSNVTNMHGMFYKCIKLKSLNLDNFNTSKVTNMNYMFYNCQILETLNISNFNTSNVTNMYRMFYKCHQLLTLDLSSFNISDSTNIDEFFWETNNLNKIIFPNASMVNLLKSKLQDRTGKSVGIIIVNEDVNGLDIQTLESFNWHAYDKNGNSLHNV